MKNRINNILLVEDEEAHAELPRRGFARYPEKYQLNIVSVNTRLTFWLIFLCCVSAAVTATAQSSNTDVPQLLILNSYHPGYPWSDNELRGILKTIEQEDPQMTPKVEFMDFKHFSDQEYVARLLEFYRFKYKRQKIDIVITIDDFALDFALKCRADIFPEAAIVFCGVNDFNDQMLAGQPRVTGVAEKLDIERTVKVALSLHPRIREIFVVHDYSATGLKTRHELDALSSMFGSQVSFRFAEDQDISQIALQLESLPPHSLVLILSYARDKTGTVFAHQDVIQLFRRHSPVPIYAVHEERLGYGIVGGSLQGGEPHGVRAAEMALMVLAGQEHVPVDLNTTARFMFDYEELNRFSVSPMKLPEGSIIINQPGTFYEKYKIIFLSTRQCHVFTPTSSRTPGFYHKQRDRG